MAYLVAIVAIGGLLMVIGILTTFAGLYWTTKILLKAIGLLADFAFGAIFSIGDIAISLAKAAGKAIHEALNWGIL